MTINLTARQRPRRDELFGAPLRDETPAGIEGRDRRCRELFLHLLG
jgi:hypothetical protein